MSRIRQRSKKQEALYVKRRKFVAEFLEEHPWCQRCMRKHWTYTADEMEAVLVDYLVNGKHEISPSTVVHEKQTRARGGDILDPGNCVALCDPCHLKIHIHLHPKESEEQGWLKSGKKKIPAF